MTVADKKTNVSTLGPINTNSYYAAKAYIKNKNIACEPVLCETAEESFDLLLKNKVQACVVCNLYPDIHKLYIPNLNVVTVAHVFIHNAYMGLYKRRNIKSIKSVAAPITSTIFLKDDDFIISIVNSNAEAASACAQGVVDAAIATSSSAEDYGLVALRKYGPFAVPYTVFKRR